MAIWRYDDWTASDRPLYQGGAKELDDYQKRPTVVNCAYCNTDLVETKMRSKHGHLLTLSCCPICGWWSVGYSWDLGYPDPATQIHRAEGSLKNLDLTDLTVPLEEATNFLISKYSDRYKIHPRRYEEVIADVFRNIGYRVILTSYSGDDGVDVVFMEGDQGGQVGVQVKRYHDKIESFQIREFGGAMVLNGLTRGIFITTSSFTQGARATASRLSLRRLAIELWDADRFYQVLKIGRRSQYQDPEDPTAPFHQFLLDSSRIPVIADFRFYAP